MLNIHNQVNDSYLNRMIYEANQEAKKLHPDVIWQLYRTDGHEIYISAKKEGGTISVRFRIEPKQLVGDDLRMLVNKMAGFL